MDESEGVELIILICLFSLEYIYPQSFVYYFCLVIQKHEQNCRYGHDIAFWVVSELYSILNNGIDFTMNIRSSFKQ
jgi:hypothetical protein